MTEMIKAGSELKNVHNPHAFYPRIWHNEFVHLNASGADRKIPIIWILVVLVIGIVCFISD